MTHIQKEPTKPSRQPRLRELPEQLLGQPERFPSPPVQTRVHLLPCRDLDWPDFERLCVEIAWMVDSTQHCGLYGRSGQKQHGIDLYARQVDGSYVVYQARDIAALTAPRLRKAVKDFVAGRRPFNPRRFVLCVACAANDTRVHDELDRLRAEHPDLDIDLYDQEELSRLLRWQRAVVERFFGSAWRDAFCGPQPTTPTSGERLTSPSSDELLRGPVRSLGLQGALVAADTLLEEQPASAAERFEAIATRLDERNFTGHAVVMRHRKAEALIAAGQPEQAFACWFDLARRDVEGGWAFPNAPEMEKLRELLPQVSVGERHRFAALDGYQRWHEAPADGIGLLRPAVEALLELGDKETSRACMWLVEAVVVDEDHGMLAALVPVIQRVLGSTEDEEVSIRLRLALAEADGHWDGLVRESSTGRLEPRWSALVHARHGRWLAWCARPEEAEDAYRRAIERATQAGLAGDVVEALGAIQQIRIRYGPIDGNLDEYQQLVRAVDARGTNLGGRRDALRAGLRNLQQDKPPEAHLALRRYLWETRLSGHFQAELEARRLLGNLYARAGEPAAAVWHLIRAGQAKEAAEIAGMLPFPLPLTSELAHLAPWVRASALEVLAAQADIRPAGEAATLVPMLLEATGGVPQSPLGGPQVGLSAHRALAALSHQLPVELIEPVVALYEPLIERDPTRYYLSDDAMLEALIGLYQAHPSARPELGRLIARCLQDGVLAQKLLPDLSSFGGLLRPLLPHLRRLAEEGNRWALDLLAGCADDHPAVLAEARRRVEAALARPVQPPRTETTSGEIETTWTPGDIDAQSSTFARLLPEGERVVLARKWLDHAREASEAGVNRALALEGIRALSQSLPREVRTEFFEAVFALIDSQIPLSEVDVTSQQTLHPLNRFRINTGFASLQRAALRASAALAATREEARRVEAAILAALRSLDSQDVRAAGQAAVWIEPSLSSLDARGLAVHPEVLIRQVAVVLWARHPEQYPELGEQFANDPERDVRMELAVALPSLKQAAPTLGAGLRARLSTDVSARVRWRARRGDSNGDES
jgi:tetratricopeptide (TPR) repeat protein